MDPNQEIGLVNISGCVLRSSPDSSGSSQPFTAAAHGNFSDYSKEDVLRIVDEVGRFLAQHLTP